MTSYSFPTGNNVTQQCTSAEDLAEQYRLMIDGSSDVVYDWNLQTQMGAFNERIYELLGLPEDAFFHSAEAFAELMHPDDRAHVKAMVQAHLYQNHPFKVEYRLRHAEGHYIDILSRGKMQHDAQGNPLRMLGTFTDITERKAMEANLRSLLEREQLIRQLVETISQSHYSDNMWEMIVREIGTFFHADRCYITRFNRSKAELGIFIDGQYCAGPDIAPLSLEDSPLQAIDPAFRNEPGDLTMQVINYPRVDMSPEEILQVLETYQIYPPGYPEQFDLETFAQRSYEYNQKYHIKSVLAIEIFYRGISYGGINMQQCRRHRIWTEDEIALLKQLVPHIGSALYQAELLQQEQKAKELAQEAEERYRFVLEGSSDGLYDWDLVKNQVYWSPQFYEMLGLAPFSVEPTFEFLLEKVHPDDRERVEREIRDHLSYSDRYQMEYRLHHAQGHYLYVLCRGRANHNNQGQPVRMSGLVRDISEQKQAIEALVESQERYRLVLDGAYDGIWDWDIQTNEVYWNDRLYDMHGLDKADYKPTLDNFLELVHPEDQEKLNQALQKHLESGDKYELEIRQRHSSGQYLTFFARGTVMRDDEGKPIRMVGTTIDITERKTSIEQLARSAQRQQDLAELSQLALSEISVDVFMDQVTTQALKTLQAHQCTVLMHDPARNQLIVKASNGQGGNLDRSMTVDVQEASFCGYTLLRNESIIVGNLQEDPRFETIFGENYSDISSTISVVIKHRQPMGVLVVCSKQPHHFQPDDIHFLQSLSSILAMGLVRRQIEVEREAAKREAESANHKKSQFLANMSHEIRTPLNSVIGYSQMLERGMGGRPLEEKELRFVRNIVSSGQHLLHMVNDILDLSKIEAGKLSLSLEWIELEPFLFDIINMLRELASRKQVQLYMELNPGICRIKADPVRLKQIFINLITNGIKFNNEGGSVGICVYPAENRRHLIIDVKDTGIGIPADKLNNLFTEFFQVDASYAKQHEGTGLGLALTKRLVQLHDGEISVESTLGEGSVFTFTLPLAGMRYADPQAAGMFTTSGS